MNKTEKRIKEIANERAIYPASEEIFNIIRSITDSSVPTDVVEASEEEFYKFATYWKHPKDDNDEPENIPADLLIERTIPITDMVLKTDKVSMRVIVELPEGRAGESLRDIHKSQESLLVGAVALLEAGIVFPLTVETDKDAIGIIGSAVILGVPYSKFKHIENIWNEHITREMVESIIYLLGTMMPAWYGIQLALLHPVTKQVFSNPKKEKRDRKERLMPVYNSKKPKSVKYVKKHVITAENCIDRYIESALDKEGQKQTGEKKRTYRRHTALWRVIGHYRTYEATGKTVWVSPYWKGMLKDIGNIEANKRLIDIPDKI